MKRGFMEASGSSPPRETTRIDAADPVTTLGVVSPQQDTDDLLSKLLPDSIIAVR